MNGKRTEKLEQARRIERRDHDWNTAASASEESSAIKRWLRLAKEIFDKDDDPTPSAA